MNGAGAGRRDLADTRREVLADPGPRAQLRFVARRGLLGLMRDDVGAVTIRANLERVLALELEQIADFAEHAGDREVVERPSLFDHADPSVSMRKSSSRAPPAASASRTAAVRSGGARQNRQPPPPAPHTLAASAPAAIARAIRSSMTGVVTPGASRLRFSHSSARWRAVAAQSPRCERLPHAGRGVADALEAVEDVRDRRRCAAW